MSLSLLHATMHKNIPITIELLEKHDRREIVLDFNEIDPDNKSNPLMWALDNEMSSEICLNIIRYTNRFRLLI